MPVACYGTLPRAELPWSPRKQFDGTRRPAFCDKAQNRYIPSATLPPNNVRFHLTPTFSSNSLQLRSSLTRRSPRVVTRSPKSELRRQTAPTAQSLPFLFSSPLHGISTLKIMKFSNTQSTLKIQFKTFLGQNKTKAGRWEWSVG